MSRVNNPRHFTVNIINPLIPTIMAYSMSHCCIENAAGIMSEALYKFENNQQDIQSNIYEECKLESLYESCKQFVEQYEEYLEDKEQYIADHSENEEDD